MQDKKLKDILIEKWQKILEESIKTEFYEMAAKAKKILDKLKSMS